MIRLGFHHFDRSIAGDDVSEYHAQAAIAATHARAVQSQSTDWPVILRLYDQLLSINESAVVALNRAVAVAKVHGPAEALAAIEPLESDLQLRDYYLFLAVRGHLLRNWVGRPRLRTVFARRWNAAARSRSAAFSRVNSSNVKTARDSHRRGTLPV